MLCILFQDVRNQGRLAAEAEQHARDVTERNRFMRRIAAQSGLMQPPGTQPCQSALLIVESLFSAMQAFAA